MNILNFKPKLAETIEELLSARDLFSSAFFGDLDGMKAAIESDPRCIYAIDECTGATALHIAAGIGSFSCVNFLLKNSDVDLFAKDVRGDTALMRAAKLGHAAVFEIVSDRMYPNRKHSTALAPGP